LRNGISIAATSSKPSRQRGILDVEHLGRWLAEMHDQIGTLLELMH